MALEKEARTNFMGSDIDARNRNWDKVSAHLADYANSQAVTIIDFEFTAGVVSNTAKITKVGKIVTLTIGLRKSDGSVFAKGHNLEIGTLPLGYRPPHGTIIPAGIGAVEWNIDSIGYVYIAANGGISVRNSSSDTAKFFYFSTSFIVN